MKGVMKISNVRRRLEERQKELQERLGRVTTDVRHSQGLEADFAEQAVQRENDDVLGSLEGTIRAELLQISRAVSRLDENRYGLCETCGQRIPSQRLEALPYATSCLKCQTKRVPRDSPRGE
jgi:RNA polymerase-binding protein DksA